MSNVYNPNAANVNMPLDSSSHISLSPCLKSNISADDICASEINSSGGLSVDGDAIFKGGITIVDERGNESKLNPFVHDVNVRLMAAVKVMDENPGTLLHDAVKHKDYYFFSEKARDYIMLKSAVTKDEKTIDEKFLVLEAMFDMPDEIEDLI